MKKIVCILLVCSLLIGTNCFAFADSDLEEKLKDFSAEAKQYSPMDNSKALMDRSSFPTTRDRVTLTDSSIVIRTADGLYISYTYPHENVLCLSQDIQQQAFLYLLFYSNNMSATASEFVEEDMHLNIYDTSTGTDIFLYACQSPLSAIVQNLIYLTDDDVMIVGQIVADAYFPDAASVTAGMIGNNLWFFADYESGGAMITFVNGIEVACTFEYVDSSGPVVGLTLLDNLTLAAAA